METGNYANRNRNGQHQKGDTARKRNDEENNKRTHHSKNVGTRMSQQHSQNVGRTTQQHSQNARRRTTQQHSQNARRRTTQQHSQNVERRATQQRSQTTMRKRRPTRTELIARKRRRKRMNQIRNKAKLTLYILIVCFAVLQLARFVGFMVFSEEDNQIETQYVALKKEDEFSDDNMSKNIEQTKDTEETESQEEADASGDGLSYEQKLSIIQSNTDIYSADLLRCATNFPEAIDFVYQYPDNKDKSFNMDLTNDYVEGEIPLLLQWDTRWGYTKYGASILGLAGCGPTCVSMVYIGLTGDIKKNPHVIAQFSEENGYYISGSGSSWMLMTEGIRGLGLQSNELILLESAMKKELDAGHYVICSMKPGDFTNSGHFIVLIGYTDEGFKVNDPNSRINSEKIWSYDTLSPQIKNLWGISK